MAAAVPGGVLELLQCVLFFVRHGRACPGHPRLSRFNKDVDTRHKAGHDVDRVISSDK
ncbi:MAG TPA: hypothetical protein VGG27_11690 [Magnetospirillaceae bacterium]|jgi:hypothetical protein